MNTLSVYHIEIPAGESSLTSDRQQCRLRQPNSRGYIGTAVGYMSPPITVVTVATVYTESDRYLVRLNGG